MNILQICKEIREYEKQLSELSIRDDYMHRRQIEIELGECYNKLMRWVELNDVEEIRDGIAYVKKKIEI